MSALSTHGHRRGSPLRGFAIVGGGTVGVLVLLYFVVTSGAFLKAVVVPRVGNAIKAKVTVQDVALSPFSSLDLQRVGIQAGEGEPILQAERMRVRYSALALIRGQLVFPEIELVGPVVNVVERADGTRNIDFLMASDTNAPPAPPRVEPLQLRLGRVAVTHGTVKYVRQAQDGSVQASEVAGLDLGVENLANDAAGKVKLSATVAQTFTPGRGSAAASSGGASTNGGYRVETRLNGGIDLRLEKDLRPNLVKGEIRLEVGKATGMLRDLAGVVGVLGCDATATDIKDLALRVERGGQRLGLARISGPIDAKKSEARLRVEVTSIDRNVLNLAGAPFGLDFAETTLSATATLDVARRGETIAASGKASASKLSVQQGGLATPPVDLSMECQCTVSKADSSAVVHRLTLTGVQGGRDVLTVGLDKAMNLAWGNTIHGLNESKVNVALTGLRLSDWRALLGTNVPSGLVDVSAKLVCQDDGQRFGGDIGIGIREIEMVLPFLPAATAATNAAQVTPWAIHGGTFNLTTRLAFRDYRSLLLEQYGLQFSQGGVQLLSASGSAGYDRVSEDGSVQATIDVPVPKVLAQFPVPGLTAKEGRLSVDGLIAKEKGQTRVGFNLALGGFNGAYENLVFDRYEAKVGLDGEVTDKYANIRRFQVMARQGVDAFGGLDVSGKYDRLLEAGDFSMNIENLTDRGLQPLLAPFLAPRQLTGGRFTGSGTAHYDTQKTNTLQFQIDVAGLKVLDPSGAIPDAPLSFQVGVDVGYYSNVVDLGRLALTLPTSQRAPRNQVVGHGTLDLRRTNAISGQFRIASDAIDLTWLADAYRTNRPLAAAGSPAASAGTNAQGGGAETEPAPMVLPIGAITSTVQIARLYLGEVTVSNWTASASVTRSTAQLDSLKLGLGEGSLSGNGRIDLSKPGYEYALDAKAARIPLEPWVNTLLPERRGQFKGELGASLQLKGAGVTSANLQKNLAVQFDAGATNLNLALGNVRSSVLKTLVNVVLSIPQIIRNPTSALGNLVGQLTGSGAATGGWVDELAKAPIDTIAGRGKVGQGRVDVQQALVRSPAFRAEAAGAVVLASVLTNSTLQLPVQVALRRELAASLSAVPAGTASNEVYVKLPDFLAIEGTVGDAKAKVDKLALAALAVKTGAGLIGNTGNASLDKAAGVLNTVGGLLGAPTGTGSTNTGTNVQSSGAKLLDTVGGLLGTPAASGTNAAAGTGSGTTAPRLLDTVGGLLGSARKPTNAVPAGTAQTNAPGTNTPAQPANPLERLLKKK